MKDREMIARLRDLRQRRENRAKETVIHRHAAAYRATLQVQDAASAVAAHIQRTADAEETAFGSLVGQPVKATNLSRLQGRFEMAAREAEQLRENEKQAGVVEGERKAELSAARRDHRASVKALTKLDRLSEQMTRRTARRRVALAELSEEDERGPSRSPTQ
jgi:hypothetical protein